MNILELRKVGKQSSKTKWYKEFCRRYDADWKTVAKWLKTEPAFEVYLKHTGYYPGKSGPGFQSLEIYSLRFPDLVGECVVCGNQTRWAPNENAWRKTCGRSCAAKECMPQKIATNIGKYGVENPSQSKVIQKKRVKTFIKRFGVDNPWKSRKVQRKSRASNLKRFGVENASQAQVIKDKKQHTSMENFGFSHWTKDPEQLAEKHTGWDEKRRGTIAENCIEKYGVRHHNQREDVKLKTKLTQLNRYGVNPGAIHNGYERKVVTDRFGKKHVVMGYETHVVAYFSRMKKVENITTKITSLPRYRYTGEDGKLHNYHPDMKIQMQTATYIVEVKSEWTLNMALDKNIRKFRVASRSCIRRGYIFAVVVYHKGKFFKAFNPKTIQDLIEAGIPVRHHQASEHTQPRSDRQ